MFRQVRKRVYSGDVPLILRHTQDTRYTNGRSNLVSSHDCVQMEATCTVDPWNDEVVRVAADSAQVIGIDEGQFMSNLAHFCEHYASLGKHIVVAALDGTADRTLWPEIQHLIPLADHFYKLHAVCVICHEQAAFTRRLDGRHTGDKPDIGGAEKYIACLSLIHI